MRYPLLICEQQGTTPSLLGQVYQPFHLFKFTTLQTQVSFVSIDRRGSPSLCSAQRGRYIVSGLSTLPECRSSTQTAYPSHRYPDGPFQATRSLVKGRTTNLLTDSLRKLYGNHILRAGHKN